MIEAPDASASKSYQDDPGQLKNRLAAEVETELDRKLVEEGRWAKFPTKDGNGVRYLDGKGGSVIINKGYPEGRRSGGDVLHRGPLRSSLAAYACRSRVTRR